MANPRTRSRGWTFTANLPEGDYDILDKGFPCDYMVWQYEMVDHMHIQGYAYFENARTMKSVKGNVEEWCGIQAHMEKSRGSPQQNRTYCTKEESRVHGPFEEGVCPAQGKRNDVAEFLLRIKENGLTEEVGMEFPQLAVQYGTKAEALVERWKHPEWKHKTAFAKPRVIVIWGDTSTGKSHEALAAGAFRRGNACSYPWNSYRGQKVVLYDEFNGSIPIDEMKEQLDGHPGVEVQQKFKDNAPFIPEVIYICSNIDPKDWYKGRAGVRCYEALERRFDEVWLYTGKWPEVVKTRVK